MAAGLSDHVWNYEEIAALTEWGGQWTRQYKIVRDCNDRGPTSSCYSKPRRSVNLLEIPIALAATDGSLPIKPTCRNLSLMWRVKPARVVYGHFYFSMCEALLRTESGSGGGPVRTDISVA
jgi:hypothetical protein